MNELPEGRQLFRFPERWACWSFDTTQHAQKASGWCFCLPTSKQGTKHPGPETSDEQQWTTPLGQSAVDFVAWDPDEDVLYLIEVKDYRKRSHGESSTVPIARLPDIVGRKARDALATLAVASLSGTMSDLHEPASRLGSAKKIEVWLDLALPVEMENYRADVSQSLRRQAKMWKSYGLFVKVSGSVPPPWTKQDGPG